MEKFKIRASNQRKIEKNIIDIIPDIISSDIPYFTEVDVVKESVVMLRNEYLFNSERKKSFFSDNIKIEVGNLSGRVYEIQINENVDIANLDSQVKEILKEKIAYSFNKKSRYYNNVKFSTDILKSLICEFKSRHIKSSQE